MRDDSQEHVDPLGMVRGVGRGAVELVIASIAQKSGLFLAGNGAHPIVSNLFSALVITAVATTLVVPIGLRCLLGWRRPP